MNNYQNILMVYPQLPPTYWGMQYYLPLIGKKALMPPLGLITIAAMTPARYRFRLVDLNCESLKQSDLDWADMVCFSAMLPQKSSLFKTAEICKAAGKLIVFGGPYPTACPEECAPYCDVLVLNEGELTWRSFLNDLEGESYKKIYTTHDKPDVTQTPIPRFDLLKLDDYGIIPVQFSRGCPFQCEFCDIIVMFGRKPRTKTPQQVLEELDAVYQIGYRGLIFIVDDNFIGNKKEAKRLLVALAAWNAEHGHPFFYGTEASVNLSDDRDLLDLMVKADFTWVFLGIETPSADSLKETRKVQNLKGSLVERVRLVQDAGLQVYGGFIIGFDNDTEDIFERQIGFISETAIANAVIGPLVALPKTPLYARMKQTGRLLEEADGDEERTIASGYTNIVTVIPRRRLLEGHLQILQTLYTPEEYFKRSLDGLCRLPYPASLRRRLTRLAWLCTLGIRDIVGKIITKKTSVGSLIGQIRSLSSLYKEIPINYKMASREFARAVMRKCPDQIPWIPHYFMMGYHYYRFTFEHVIPGLSALIEKLPPADEQEGKVITQERVA
jgi:Fe-S oxidoreductase